MRGKPASFDIWAAQKLGVSTDELSLGTLARLPELRDLPEGPDSELGGQTQAVLDSPTESELVKLAELGEELLRQLPELPEGFVPSSDDGPAEDMPAAARAQAVGSAG